MTKRGFEAVMSSGPRIKFDDDEMFAVERALGTGGFAKVRQGIINGRHLVSIVADEEREVCKQARELARGYDDAQERYEAAVRKGIRPLRDIFADSELLEGSRSDLKLLNE